MNVKNKSLIDAQVQVEIVKSQIPIIFFLALEKHPQHNALK